MFSKHKLLQYFIMGFFLDLFQSVHLTSFYVVEWFVKGTGQAGPPYLPFFVCFFLCPTAEALRCRDEEGRGGLPAVVAATLHTSCKWNT